MPWSRLAPYLHTLQQADRRIPGLVWDPPRQSLTFYLVLLFYLLQREITMIITNDYYYYYYYYLLALAPSVLIMKPKERTSLRAL